MSNSPGVIGILTGGGDVPGLNPAIRAVTIRALREGYKVIGIRRGWAGLVDIIRDKKADNSNNFRELTEETVNRAGRTGGTFLHSSRTNPTKIKKDSLPEHLKDKYTEDVNDVTSDVLKNLDFLGIDYLIPIGGDDTLSYGVRMYQEGVKVVAIPKTMDNDVPGTDYCIGFSTCVTRTIEMANSLRTVAGSHERIMVLEVFGRYAGFTAMLPTMAGAAHRCVIPEYKFKIERLAELLLLDRKYNPSNYSVVLVSEGAMFVDVYCTGPQQQLMERVVGDKYTQLWHDITVQNIAPALRAARAIGLPIIYVNNSAPRVALERSEFAEKLRKSLGFDMTEAFTEPMVDPREYHQGPAVQLQFPAAVEPQPGDHFVRKHCYSGFFDTRLDTLLRNLRVHNLICVGFVADACLFTTIADAVFRNYKVILLRDCTLASELPHEVEELRNTQRMVLWIETIIGTTVTSEEFVQACDDRLEPGSPAGAVAKDRTKTR